MMHELRDIKNFQVLTRMEIGKNEKFGKKKWPAGWSVFTQFFVFPISPVLVKLYMNMDIITC